MANEPVKTNNGVSGWFWLIPIVLIIIGIGFGLWACEGTAEKSQAAVYPIAADAQDVWPEVGGTVKIKIRPNCWSGWIHLPPEGQSFRVANRGELEIKYWNGKCLLITDDQPPYWDKNVPKNAVFQLRGTIGEVTITVD